jgi:hypothetical protein
MYEFIKPARGQQSLFPMMTHAEFSEDRVYRYSLTRHWNQDGKLVNFVMCNPSVADEMNNDPTIRRCISFADRWGYGGLVVTNLFAYRSTDPRQLRNVNDPVGPENDQYLLKYAHQCHKTVCAWGNHGTYRSRHQQVVDLLKDQVILFCLALTGSGQPHHPLRLKGNLNHRIWYPESGLLS